MNSIKTIVSIFLKKLTKVFSILCVLMVLTVHPVRAQKSNSRDAFPFVLQSGERVIKNIHDKIYAIETGMGKGDERRAITKMYFKNEKSGAFKKLDVFPANAKHRSTFLNSFKLHHSLYRRFVHEGKEVEDILVLDNQGNVLMKRADCPQKFYWNDKKKQAMEIDGFNGMLNFFEADGKKITTRKYSNHLENKKAILANEDSTFCFMAETSEDGKYIAFERGNFSFYEITLVNVDGDVLFQKSNPSLRMSPMWVDSENRIVLVTGYNEGKEDWYYSGYDFSGKALWVIDGKDYWLKLDRKTGIIKFLKRSSPDMETHQRVDIKTGEIVSLKRSLDKASGRFP